MPARKRSSKASRARRQEGRYLTPVTDATGAVIGYRFNPGPRLRAAGAKSHVLQDEGGRWLSFEAAKAYRDAALRQAKGEAYAIARTVDAAPARTLNALWTLYETTSDAFTKPYPAHEFALSPATRKFYRICIRAWLAFAGEEPAAALTGEIIKAHYLIDKEKRGHHRAHASLRTLMAALTFGVQRGWIAANPALKLGLASPKGRLRLGTQEELSALVAAADAAGEQGVADAIVAAVWTVQRQGDVFGCDLRDQLRDGFLIFGRTFEGDFSIDKTGASVMIPVLDPLKMRLRGRTQGPLTAAPNGARWTASAFRTRFKRIRAKAAETIASVATLRFQDLRDTGITRLYLAGVQVSDIAYWSGHSVNTIQQILSDHYLVRDREASRRVGQALDRWRLKEKVQV